MHRQTLLLAFAFIAMACSAGSAPGVDEQGTQEALNLTPVVAKTMATVIAPTLSQGHLDLAVATAEARLMSPDEVQKMFAKSDSPRLREPTVEEAFQAIERSTDRSRMRILIDQYLEAVSALPNDQQIAAKNRLVEHFAQAAHP